MKNLFKHLLLGALFVASNNIVSAAEQGTAAEASAMVKKAVLFLKQNGKEKTLAEASNPKGQFIDRDLYLSIYDLSGKVVAHGANPRLIGVDVSTLRDADNKYFVKEILNIAGAAGSGWVDYKWVDPVTKKILDKSVYLEKAGDIVIAAGSYKK